MPTYVYECEKGHRFELFHSISDDSAKRCPECGAESKRVPSGGAGLLFKGSGFYITDYRSAGYKDAAKQEGGARTEKPATGTGSGASPGGASGGAGESKPSPPAGGDAAPGAAKPSKPESK